MSSEAVRSVIPADVLANLRQRRSAVERIPEPCPDCVAAAVEVEPDIWVGDCGAHSAAEGAGTPQPKKGAGNE